LEGDFIETVEGLFFAVKGLRHPEGMVVAYLRYIPDDKGGRTQEGRRYRRVYDLGETTSFLQETHPKYINLIPSINQRLQSIPHEKIHKAYKPRERLREIMESPRSKLEETIRRFVTALSTEGGVSHEFLGISGSVLIGMDTPASDIDLNVYGESAGYRIYEALKRLKDSTDWVNSYSLETVMEVTSARWGDTGIDLSRLAEIEARKVLHGRVCGVDYFVRLLKEPGEVDASSKPLGRVTVSLRVVDSSHSIFTPCSYEVNKTEYIEPSDGAEVSELLSFRGKFTEQVREGEAVIVKGALEEVNVSGMMLHRIVLGGRGDYLVPLDLISNL